MASFLRYSMTAVALVVLLLCISCEKHPVGQIPDVQREQVDPATRVWTAEDEENKSDSSAAPSEPSKHETR